MSLTVIDDRHTRQYLIHSGDTLVVTKTGVVDNDLGNCLYLDGTQITVRVDGALYASSDGILEGSVHQHFGNTIVVGDGGVVSADGTGIAVSGPGDHLVNDGSVFGFGGAVFVGAIAGGQPHVRIDNGGTLRSNFVAVSVQSPVDLTNTGEINGPTGVLLEADGSTIENTGSILGTTAITGQSARIDNFGLAGGSAMGIEMHGALGSVIVNTGRISGAVAIKLSDQAADDRLSNGGLISGDVFLGGGSDRFDGRGGSVIGDVHGGDGSDGLAGGGSNDSLYGDAESDTLNGRDGDDVLVGGTGDDLLKGGRGDDVFVFQGAADGADRILDFHAGQDLIDLSLIDADPGISKDQSFTFIGVSGFTHLAGQLRYDVSGGAAHVQADVNGDGAADFSITLAGVTNLHATDFVL